MLKDSVLKMANWVLTAVTGGKITGDRRGVTAVEYAIIVGVMAAAIVTGIPTIGPSISNIFTHVSAEL